MRQCVPAVSSRASAPANPVTQLSAPSHPVGGAMITGLRAVVADALPLWRQAVETVLKSLDVDTVGSAATPAEGIELLHTHNPEILVTDLDFGGDQMEGAAFVRAARRINAELSIVVLSMHQDQSRVMDALHAGASAYAVKSVKPEDLAGAIRQTFEHSVFIAPLEDHQTRLDRDGPDGPAEVSGNTSIAPVPEHDFLGSLTKREREILELVAEGHSNSAIAGQLWVTEQTVKFHLSNIYRKLGATNRTQASQWFHRRRAPNNAVVNE
jgi:DNA-binding NarL/FixJ family response regulator